MMPRHRAGGLLTAMVVGVVLLAASASAQRTEFRDPAGNLLGYIQQENGRSVLRDPAGNPRGYWQKEGGWLVHRDNAGNLLDRQRTEAR